jgi:hypothetical protein
MILSGVKFFDMRAAADGNQLGAEQTALLTFG